MISYEIKAVLDEDTISNDDLNTFKLHMKGPELIGAAEAFRHYLKNQLKHCEPKNHDSLAESDRTLRRNWRWSYHPEISAGIAPATQAIREFARCQETRLYCSLLNLWSHPVQR